MYKKPIHVIPLNDLRKHTTTRDCWCFPTLDEEEDTIYVHHSMDRREEYEDGRKSSTAQIREEKQGAEGNWRHLKQYGYAPGNYMSKCRSCGATPFNLDKRATTCRPCAEAMHQKAALAAKEK